MKLRAKLTLFINQKFHFGNALAFAIPLFSSVFSLCTPTPQIVLKNIYFKSATEMREIKKRSVQLAIVTPPYVNPRTEEALAEDRRLISKIFEQLSNKLKLNGVIAVAQTDLANGGSFYWRHDMFISVARTFGFHEFDHKFEIRSLNTNPYRRMIRNVILFRREQGKVAKNKVPAYEPTGWLLTKNQNINGFRDAVSPDLAKILIERFSNPGDLVLNPFAGSGTIVAVAMALGREARGYELNREMAPTILKRAAQIDDFFLTPGEASAHVITHEAHGLTPDQKEFFALNIIFEGLKHLPPSKQKNDLASLCKTLLGKK